MFSQYVPRYDLEIKALCYRRTFPAPERFPPRRRNGHTSDVEVRITVLPHTTMLSLMHHYTSGHAWMIDDDYPPIHEPVEALLSPQMLDEVAEIQADPARWTPEVLLGLFETRTDKGTQRVSAAQADFYELGQSAALDGRLPNLTLRLGRAHDEIVLDHSFRGLANEREIEHRERFEPPATPAALAAIEATFGADMARAAAYFRQTRERWFQ